MKKLTKFLTAGWLLAAVSLAGAEDSTMVLKMTKAWVPGGGQGKLGTMAVTVSDESKVLKVRWEYPDGTVYTGHGVSMGGTGYLATSFGSGAAAIALYKRTDGGAKVEALWGLAQDGAAAAPYKMTKGASDSEYNIENGGGTFTVDMGEGGAGTAAWALPSGKFTGIVVAEGDFLAAVSLPAGADAGVGLYKLDMNTATAKGVWTAPGEKGTGGEEYKVVSVGGEPVGGGAAPEEPAPAKDPNVFGDPMATPEGAVLKIAADMRQDMSTVTKYKPTAGQIKAIAATDADAAALTKYVEEVYPMLKPGPVKLNEDQTEILLRGPDLDQLPGGYGQVVSHFKPGVKFYGFKYVKSGESMGMAFDGVIPVGKEWIFIPKAFRAFKE